MSIIFSYLKTTKHNSSKEEKALCSRITYFNGEPGMEPRACMLSTRSAASRALPPG